MPRWPKIAVAARKPRSWWRPVVCERPDAMCEPRYSGGSSCPVQRSMRCRSSGSMQSDTHTRSVRSSTARSTRAPPDEQDSISRSGMGGAELVEQPVERQRLGVHAGPPAVGLRARLDEVAVVVPLDVADVVLVEQRQHLALDVRVRLGDAEVEHLLVAGTRPATPAAPT